MNIYHISQTENNDYDTYSDAVVIAPNAETARRINPSCSLACAVEGNIFLTDEDLENPWTSWVSSIDNVKVTLIGVADENEKQPRVVCASFHAG